MKSDLILCKLIILYMLDKVDFPLKNSNITQFIIDSGYTTYFNIQQSFSELSEKDLIKTSTINDATQYTITNDGRQTLDFFHNDLSKSIKNDIIDFFANNKIQMRNETSIYADYIPEKNNEYTVSCFIKEKETTLLSLSFNVLSVEDAKKACDSWRDAAIDLYKHITSKLL